MNKFEYKNLTPFKWFVLENFPFIEADFDALTEWQLFCKLGKEMNKIINSGNTLGTQMENVTNAFIDLQNYVNNFFTDLNIQDEINNKLNDMASDGTLAKIINEEIFNELDSKINKISQPVKVAFPSFNHDSLSETTNGDCAIIKTKNKTFMIDTFFKEENFEGIKNAMKELNTTKLDYLLITHYDEDHYSNLEKILQNYDCSNCLFLLPRVPNNTLIHSTILEKYSNVLAILNSYNITNYRFCDNESIMIDDLEVNFFNASIEDLEYYDNLNAGDNDYNNYSICCEILNGNKSILFTGDISKLAQNYITKKYLKHSYDLLKVPHHGYTYLQNDFIELVNPKIAIIEATKGFWYNDQYYNSSFCSYLSSLGRDIYIIGFQNTTTIFNFTSTNISLISKSYSSNGLNISGIIENLYIDSEKANNLRLGTEKNPFYSLREAVSLINRKHKAIYNIYINNISDSDKDVKINNLENVNIYGNNNNLNRLYMYRCNNINFYNCKFNHNLNDINDFELYLKNCQNICFYDTSSTSESVTFLRGELSSIYFADGLEIKNKTNTFFALFQCTFRINANASLSLEINNNVFMYGNGNNIITGNDVVNLLKSLRDKSKIMPYENYKRNIFSENWKDVYELYNGNVEYSDITLSNGRDNFDYLEVYTRDTDEREEMFIVPKETNLFNIYNFAPSSDSSQIYSKLALCNFTNAYNLNISRQTNFNIGSNLQYNNTNSIGIYKIIGKFK